MQVRDADGRVLGDLPDSEPRAAMVGIGCSVPVPLTGPDLGAMRGTGTGNLYLVVERCSPYNCTVAWLPGCTPAEG